MDQYAGITCQALAKSGCDRLRLLREGDHRFLVLIEESVLRNVIGGAEVMAGQLGHLITVASLPSVSLGIIPMGLDRDAVWPVEDFWIFDDRQVNVELVSGWLTLTQPREIAMYGQDVRRAGRDRGAGRSGAGAHHGRDRCARLNRRANTCKFVYSYSVCGVGYLYPVGTIPGEYREITVTSLDLTGLMDQLDDLLPSGHGAPGQQPS